MKKSLNPQAKRWLWYIIILLAVITCLTSCSTVSKVKRSGTSSFDSSHKEETAKVQTAATDSNATNKKVDSSHVQEETTKTIETEFGYDIIELDSGSTVEVIDPNDYFPPPVVVTKPNGKKEVYIPKKKETSTEKTTKTENKSSTEESKTEVKKKDSTAEKSKVDVDVSKKETNKEKTVKRFNYSWIVWIIGLLVIAGFVYRYRKKIKALIWPV